MKAKLVVVGGEAKAAEVNLKLPTVIGRGREAPLTLPHPLVSRQHCEIFERNGQLVVRDLGSLNGTFINNERVTEAVLPNGELLTIGTVTFRAVYDDSAAAKSDGKARSKPHKIVASDKTIGQPSDPTVDVGPAGASKHVAKTQPASKSHAPSKPKGRPQGDPADAAGKATRPSPAAHGSSTMPAQADTLRAPVAKPAAPAAGGSSKKKAWAQSAQEVEPKDFTQAEDDFELGEDDELHAPATLPPAGEFTLQINKPAGFGKRKSDDDDFDVEELDFSGPAPAPVKPAAIVKPAPVAELAGDLTTNFDPQKLAEVDKARKLAKEQAQAQAAKPPARPAAKVPADKEPKGDKPLPEEAPKKSDLSTDEDLEAFFKSLG